MYSFDSADRLTWDGTVIRCSWCGSEMTKDDLVDYTVDDNGNVTDVVFHEDCHGNRYCESCSEDLRECEDCGEVYHTDNMYFHERCENGDEGYICSNCEDNYENCYFCGEPEHHDNGHWVDCYVGSHGRVEERFVCDYCYEGENDSVQSCDRCGCLVHEDEVYYDEEEEEYLCPVCHGTNNSGRDLHSYHYTSEPGYCMPFLGVEHRRLKPLLGTELEIENGGQSNNNAKIIREAIGKEYVVCCTDGSLYDGFEIISCPASLEHHMKTLKWEEGIKKARELHYRSHDGGHCGLHVHIDREYFENDMREDVEAKFFIVLRNNLHWIRQFSRRFDYRYCVINGYEHNEDGTGDSLGAITYPPDKVWLNSKKQQGRHCALNFYNNNTIEIRIFRGTLNYTTFVATLQMAHMWAELVKKYSLNDITRVSFQHFYNLAQRYGFHEWIKYCTDRNILDNNNTNS